jgi:replication factor C large subunit
MNHQSLVEKYRPEQPSDIYGHSSTVEDIKSWASDWDTGDIPLLLHGPAGTGKTSTAEAIANYAGWEYVEVNASSNRRKEDIEFLAQQMRSVGENKTLFVLDEVDSIDGRSLNTFYTVLDNTPNPVICTANEAWKVPDGLENRCKKYKFKVNKDDIKKAVKDIAEKEDINISNREIGQLATRNGIRDAINDLQDFAESDSSTDWDNRQTDDSPFAVTRRVILNKDYIGDMTPDDEVAFLNENVKGEFDGIENMRAYQALSEADKWLNHTNTTQDYSWWSYVSPIAEEVSNLRITEPYNDWVNINYPSERRNYQPQSTGESDEAKLYREIKDKYGFSGSFSFDEFRNYVFPLIQELDDEQKRSLSLSHSLSEECMDIIGVDSQEVENTNQSSSETKNSSISNFVDEESDEGVFDY